MALTNLAMLFFSLLCFYDHFGLDLGYRSCLTNQFSFSTLPSDFATSTFDLHSVSDSLRIIKWNDSVSQAHSFDSSGSSFQADDAQSQSNGMPRDTFPLEDDSPPAMYSEYADYHGYYTLNNGTPGTGMASNSNTFTPGSVFVQGCYSPFFNGQVCSYLPEPHVAAMLEPPALDATCSMQTAYENMGYYPGEPISSIADFSTVHQSHPYSTYNVPVGNETPFDPQIMNPPEITNIISPTWQSQPTTSEQPHFQVHDTYCSKAFPSDPNCRPSNNMHAIGYQDSQHPSPASASNFAQMRKKVGPVITVTIPQNWTKTTKSPSTQTYDSTQLDNGLSHLSTPTDIHRLEDGPGTET